MDKLVRKLRCIFEVTPPQKHWFKDEDGSYYRNGPLVIDEMRPGNSRKHHHALLQEIHQIWREGITTKDALEPGDIVVTRAPFNVSYPELPELSRFLDDKVWSP